jgi:hypothetical protein
MKQFKYLKYLLKHKWYVSIASIKIKSSIWRALVHDLSKFRISEWIHYANYFYSDGSLIEFNYAWNAHQKCNKHHWQYWLLIHDNEKEKFQCLEMPLKYTKEMVADWAGAGKAITGKWEVKEWYAKNKDNILIHQKTRIYVEFILDKYF